MECRERGQVVTVFLILSVSKMNGLLQVFDRIWIVYYLSANCTENPAFFVEKVTICVSHGQIVGKVSLLLCNLKSSPLSLTLWPSILCIGKWAADHFKQGYISAFRVRAYPMRSPICRIQDMIQMNLPMKQKQTHHLSLHPTPLLVNHKLVLYICDSISIL